MSTQHPSLPEPSPGQWQSSIPPLSSQSFSSLVLGAGFGLTGAGTVLLGVLLPVFSAKWALRDNIAGWLFFLQFLGSSLGALVLGKDLVRGLRIGYALLAVCAGGLAFTSLAAAFPLLFFYGLGLGMAMTSTSLLFSDRYGDDRAAKLERLNFAWSAGAAMAPALLVPFVRLVSLRPIFFAFQALYAFFLAWTIAGEKPQAPRALQAAGTARESKSKTVWFLLPLAVMALCSVGVETSLSSWLTTYSHRVNSRSLGAAAFTTALFLLGFVLSRLAFSTRLLAMIGRRRALHILLACSAVCVILLTAAHSLMLIRIAAALAGFSIGPLYPLLLSFLLERSARGWVFAVAGIGSIVFPWLTGVLSAHYGSLRHGLVAPCAAALLMILLLPSIFRAAPATVPAAAEHS